MTNEEAIKWLKVEASYIEEDVGNGKEILEAYDMAIKALEQEPCDDYVDKKELLKSIEVALDATDINDEYSIGLRNGMRLVKSFVDGKRPDYEKVSHLKKQQPCEDCISRKDFIAKVKDIYYGYMLDDDGCCPQDFVDLAEEMPSVTPQVKIGYWIRCDILQELKCSECRRCFRNKTNFCPNCGCRMKGESE